MNTDLKYKTIQQLIQSELDYINELFTFEKLYSSKLKHWLDSATMEAKNTAKIDLQLLSNCIHSIAMTHTNFIKQLRNR